LVQLLVRLYPATSRTITRRRSLRSALAAGLVGATLLCSGFLAGSSRQQVQTPATGAPTTNADGLLAGGLITEGQRANPATFTPAELQELQRRFGVHGPQPRLAQLFTKGVDQLTPLRHHTVGRLEDLRPVVLRESRRTGINPMLLAAILFDEMQHAKPGEDLPLAAHSGLFSTHGPAQLGLSEMVKQGLLKPDASPAEIEQARNELLDPDRNVALLAGKLARLLKLLHRDASSTAAVSSNPSHAKTVATLAYLHNGKLDYPTRILRYMQDPELHGLLFSQQKKALSPLI